MWLLRTARERIIALAAAEPLAYQPGTRSLYSDLGFILLGELVERGLGGRLDALAEEFLFAPLGLRATGFAGSAALRGRTWRRPNVVRCAGACSAARCTTSTPLPWAGWRVTPGFSRTLRICLGWPTPCAPPGAVLGRQAARLLVPAEVLRLFWRPAGIPGSTWRLGWDGPAATGSLAGDRLSRQAVGHLGFTGCSLWIDPERETCIVLLTNFVHPTVHKDPRFRSLRPALHDAALDAIGYRA